MRRALLASGTAVLLAVAAVSYSIAVSRPPVATGATIAIQSGRLYFRDGGGQIASVARDDPGGARTSAGITCQRFAAAATTAVCLTADLTGGLPTSNALILDRALHETRRLQLAGIPSRAQVSRSGRMVSWTVFVTGDSYNRGGFSTWTGILDTRTGYAVTNIENIHLYIDGKRVFAADVNYWGVTFAADDNRFYATVSTRGKVYLVEGDYARWEAHSVLSGVECPSLSPDGARLAFKKRIPAPSSAAAPWRLAVLDLATLRQIDLADPGGVDDQAVWLDDRTVAYAKAHGPGSWDVWSMPADGSGVPRLLIADASSPVLLS
jgi:hypothetical protein